MAQSFGTELLLVDVDYGAYQLSTFRWLLALL